MPSFPAAGGGPPPNSFVTAPQLFYVSPGGDNSSGDGSQFHPFETMNVAVAAVQSIGGGGIQYAPFTRCHTVQGAGLWLRGRYDTGVGGPGWVSNVDAAMTIEPWIKTGGQFTFGGLGLYPGGTASTFSDSAIWISGTLGGLTLNGMSAGLVPVGSPAMRLGLGSPLNTYSALTTYAIGDYAVSGGIAYASLVNGNVGHTPVSSPTQWQGIRVPIADGLAPSLTAMVRFSDSYWEKIGDNNGPAVDIGAGFWYYFNQCVIARATNGSTPLTNAGMRQWSDGSGDSYLTYMTNSRLSGMGCYLYGGCELNMDSVTGENMNVMGCWRGDNNATGVGPRGVINLTTMADSAVGVYVVQNNGVGFVHVTDSDEAGGNVRVDTKAQVTSVISVGQSGITGASAELFHEGGRRLHTIGTCGYKNIAAALQWFTPSYVKGPDGAAAGTHTAAVLADDFFIYNEANGFDAPAVGDYFAWGVWLRWDSTNPTDQGFDIHNTGTGNLGIFYGGPQGSSGVGDITLGASQFITWLSPIPTARARWTYYSGWLKITAKPAGSVLRIQASPSTSGLVSHAQPWMIHVPAADALDAGEVASIAMHSRPFPNNGENTTAFTAAPPAPTVGMPALPPGAKLAFWDATLHQWTYITVDNGALVIS